MKILYIHQYFATPNGSTGTRSYEFARRWVAAGHSVMMLTSTAQLCGQEIQDSKGRIIKRIMIDGIDVRAVWIPYNQTMGFIIRLISFVSFVLFACVFVLFIRKPDIIYATSTPLTVGVPALTAKWLRGIPFIFEVRDQWPEIPIELGIIKNKLLIRILLWLERTIYKNSSAIIACSPGQANGIRAIAGNSKELAVISNCCDINLFSPSIDGADIRIKHNWNDKLVLLHAGAMGKVNSLHFVIDAAERLRDKNILFVLIGQGNEKSSLEKRVQQLGLKNVQILPSVSKHELPFYFAASNIGLVIIGNYPIIEHNSANKFFDALSAGKPVLLNYSGWQRKIVEDNKAGLGCSLASLDEFVQKVSFFADNPDEVEDMGLNARRLAVEIFSRDQMAKRSLDVLESIV